MTLLVQISDTHILPPGELLYGTSDTAAHLADAVSQIRAMRPAPDIVMVTGDLAERSSDAAYGHFIDLISPLQMPVYVIPGNHDKPELLPGFFDGTPYFPAEGPTYQYCVEDLPFRVIGLNSNRPGSELPAFGNNRLLWLEEKLDESERPTVIAIHHPPMKTGIEFIDMGGTEWFQGLKSVLQQNPQVKLVICGHCHTDLVGQIGGVPVYMAGSTAHQLVASRGLDEAPSFIDEATAPVLHHFIDGEFLSGSNPWPPDSETLRIDGHSGMDWQTMKEKMRGNAADP